MKVTKSDLIQKKLDKNQIVMLTCYDYPTALLEDRLKIDVQLVGDSVGTNVLGYSDVSQVTVEDMLHHLRAVVRGVRGSFILCDMPYRSFDSVEKALTTAQQFVEVGADGIKIEGEKEAADIIRYLVDNGNISVCGHIGYKPQFDGPDAKVQGKDPKRAIELLEAALAIEEAGAFMLVIELVPEQLAKEITQLLRIPTIGIGAGRYCDGQVQVVNDILGISNRVFRHSKEYLSAQNTFAQAITSYVGEVKNKSFPSEKNVTQLPEDASAEVDAWLKSRSNLHAL